MKLLQRGDRVHLHEPRDGGWRGVVTEDQIAGDRVIYFRLEGDDPQDLGYGKRTAWRHELSFVPDIVPLRTPMAGTWSRLE